jgi:hypothetical protein
MKDKSKRMYTAAEAAAHPGYEPMALRHWSYEREVELMDNRTKPPTPTGTRVRLWGGWEWDTKDGRTYRTNAEGEGLWRWMEQAGEYRQVQGTCQFALSEDRETALRELAVYRFELAQDELATVRV